MIRDIINKHKGRKTMTAVERSQNMTSEDLKKMSLEDYKKEVEACLNERYAPSLGQQELMKRYEEDFEEFLRDGWKPNVAATAMVQGY